TTATTRVRAATSPVRRADGRCAARATTAAASIRTARTAAAASSTGDAAAEEHDLVDARIGRQAGDEREGTLRSQRERHDDAVVDPHRVLAMVLEPPHPEAQEERA